MSRVRRSSTTMAAAAVLALAISGGTAAAASAATPVTCASFTYQEDAQAALALNPADPGGLDPDKNGIACDSLPPHRPVVTPPTTTPVTPTTTTAPATTTTTTTTVPTTTPTSSATTSPVVTSTTATSAAATTAPTTVTKNCSDFTTQALAQAFLLANPTDPSGLDADKDGVACEDKFGTQNQQVAVIPNGAVRTGGLPPR